MEASAKRHAVGAGCARDRPAAGPGRDDGVHPFFTTAAGRATCRRHRRSGPRSRDRAWPRPQDLGSVQANRPRPVPAPAGRRAAPGRSPLPRTVAARSPTIVRLDQVVRDTGRHHLRACGTRWTPRARAGRRPRRRRHVPRRSETAAHEAAKRRGPDRHPREQRRPSTALVVRGHHEHRAESRCDGPVRPSS